MTMYFNDDVQKLKDELAYLRAEVEKLERDKVTLRNDFDWQTKNANNCRADASRTGDEVERLTWERDTLSEYMQCFAEGVHDNQAKVAIARLALAKLARGRHEE